MVGAVSHPPAALNVHTMDKARKIDTALHDLLEGIGHLPPGLAIVKLETSKHTPALGPKRGGTLTVEYSYDQPLAFTRREMRELVQGAFDSMCADLGITFEDDRRTCCGRGECGGA